MIQDNAQVAEGIRAIRVLDVAKPKSKILVASTNTRRNHLRLLQGIVRAQRRILPACELIIPPANDEWFRDRAILELAPEVEVMISAKPPRDIMPPVACLWHTELKRK
jgi:hypothetical protein